MVVLVDYRHKCFEVGICVVSYNYCSESYNLPFKVITVFLLSQQLMFSMTTDMDVLRSVSVWYLI